MLFIALASFIINSRQLRFRARIRFSVVKAQERGKNHHWGEIFFWRPFFLWLGGSVVNCARLYRYGCLQPQRRSIISKIRQNCWP